MKQRSDFKTDKEFRAYIQGRIDMLTEQIDDAEMKRYHQINHIKQRLRDSR